MWRWKRAYDVLSTAIERYPNDPNYYYNLYRIGRCEERLGNYQAMVDILRDLITDDAHEVDARVPHTESLMSKASKLVEIHDLQ